MKAIEAVIRPSRLDAVKEAVTALGVGGMTVTDVHGCGHQRERTVRRHGATYTIDLLPKMKLELVVRDDQVDAVVNAILEAGRTGEVGDGKIFLTKIDDAVRIHTGERGEGAL